MSLRVSLRKLRVDLRKARESSASNRDPGPFHSVATGRVTYYTGACKVHFEHCFRARKASRKPALRHAKVLQSTARVAAPRKLWSAIKHFARRLAVCAHVPCESIGVSILLSKRNSLCFLAMQLHVAASSASRPIALPVSFETSR